MLVFAVVVLVSVLVLVVGGWGFENGATNLAFACFVLVGRLVVVRSFIV